MMTSGVKPSRRRLRAVVATASARRIARSKSLAAGCTEPAGGGVGARYGTLRTPAMWLSFGSVLKTISWRPAAVRWRSRCRY